MIKEYWEISKRVARSANGVVVSQHHTASAVGARILAEGGNAMDAAIATSFAIGVVEPWMSGLGGGGMLLAASPGQKQCSALYFNMKSSSKTDVKNYPLVGGLSHDLFSWPAVLDDRNVHGPYSIAIPGQVAGMATAHAHWGSIPWKELIQPSIELCQQGLDVDWMSTLRIAAAASGLRRYSGHHIYLPDGEVPAGQWGGPAPKIINQQLTSTLQQLASAGARDFYSGDIACSILSDAKEQDIPLTADDLFSYRPIWKDPLSVSYKNHTVSLVPGLTGGPSLGFVLEQMEKGETQVAEEPDGSYFTRIADALDQTFKQRINGSGESESSPGCTTHINVVDRGGYTVSLTQTLLSVFGSKLTLPKSGILMNNGMMWFDPEPGKENSIGMDKYPLCNMCPAIICSDEGKQYAVGSSGGRRIVGAVAQLTLWLTDFGMDIESAMTQPRIDVSGNDSIYVDTRLAENIYACLAEQHSAERAQSTIYPNLFACPNVASWSNEAGAEGMPFIYSPLAAAVSADDV